MLRSIVIAVAGLGIVGAVVAAPLPRDSKPNVALTPTAAGLVTLQAVRDELDLTTDQLNAFATANWEIRTAIAEAMRRIEAAGPLQDVERIEREIDRVMSAKATVFAASVLTPNQRTRLGQIDRQVRGPLALADSAVRDALSLSVAQSREVSGVVDVYRATDDRLRRGEVDGDEEKLRTDRVAAREVALREVDAALTVTQRDTWKSLLGPPVKHFRADDLYIFQSGGHGVRAVIDAAGRK